ncbi:hypothetical protein [Nocardia brasiliensis]|uniref:hypothetical protein n=1 Tax=Nocardia brasiliensis TaxID=37326 RepID=UPI003D90B3F3
MSRLDSILWPAGSQAALTVDAQTVRDLNLEDIFTIVTRGIRPWRAMCARRWPIWTL